MSAPSIIALVKYVSRLEVTQQLKHLCRTMSQDEYDRISDQDMEKLHENLEVLCEEYGPEDWEVEYSVRLLSLSVA